MSKLTKSRKNSDNIKENQKYFLCSSKNSPTKKKKKNFLKGF